VKPRCQFDQATFPRTDYFFHSGTGRWHGHSSPNDDRWEFRTGYNLSREYLIQSAREWVKEMVAFSLIIIASAWPVIYMIVSVVQLLHRTQPLDR
jgi:hypothetical protein